MFLEDYEAMADVDIDPFGNQNNTCQIFLFNPGGGGSV